MSLSSFSRPALLIFHFGCSENKLESYNGKYYYVGEGVVVSEKYIDKEIDIGNEVFRVSYDPAISKDSLFLHFLTSKKLLSKSLEEFENLLRHDKVREATKNEIVNAQLYKEKKEDNYLKDFVTIKGRTVKVGDLADDVYEIFTKNIRIEEPAVLRDQQGEILYITQFYLIDGVQYNLLFKRRQQSSDDYCYDCPYRLRGIIEYPYISLTFNEYMKKYWVQTKD